MFTKCLSLLVCNVSFLYTFYVLCSFTYFLSGHGAEKEEIISSKNDENVDFLLSSFARNILLLSIFILQHLLMSTEFVKHLFCRLQIDYLERSIYNICSTITLHLLINKWLLISSNALWKVNTSSDNALWITFTAFHVLAWSIIYSGCLMMDISELAGVKQVYYKFSSRPSPMVMKSKELLRYYSHMRHPSFTGLLIVLWIYPYMTLDRLLLASILTIYVTLRCTIDEKDYNYNAYIVQRKQRELIW